MHQLRSLKAWTCARRVARSAYRLTMEPPLKHHFGLADQIRRAAASIPANIAEGYGLGTRPQLIRCLRTALAEAYELQWHIELATYVGLIDRHRARTQYQQGTQVIRLLIGLLKRLDSEVPH